MNQADTCPFTWQKSESTWDREPTLDRMQLILKAVCLTSSRTITGYPFPIWVGGSVCSDGEMFVICKDLDHLVHKKRREQKAQGLVNIANRPRTTTDKSLIPFVP